MLNLSELTRHSGNVPLRMKLKEFVETETYLVESVADYKENKSRIVSPWFKKNNLLLPNHDYAFVIFHYVGINGISDGKKVVENYVEIQDKSDSEIMCWTEKGDIYPAQKPYSQMLKDNELKIQDEVYMLIIRHSFYEGIGFVAEVVKNNFDIKMTKKKSLIDKINLLLPEMSPAVY